jgi:hypothetical protein
MDGGLVGKLVSLLSGIQGWIPDWSGELPNKTGPLKYKPVLSFWSYFFKFFFFVKN